MPDVDVETDLPALGRELHGIAEQVHDNLADLLLVAPQERERRRHFDVEGDLLLVALGNDGRRRAFDDRRRVEVADVQTQVTGLHAGEVEDLGDEPQQALALVHDGLDVVALLVVEDAGQTLQQHFRIPDHRRQRRSQLVAHRGQEIGLELVEFLEALVLLVKAGVFVLHLLVRRGDALDVHLRRENLLEARVEDDLDDLLHLPEDLADEVIWRPTDGFHQAIDLTAFDATLDLVDFLRGPRRRVGHIGPEDQPPHQVAFVDDGHHDIAQPGEALDHPGLFGAVDDLESIVLEAGDNAGAGLPRTAELPEVAAELGVADADVDELVAGAVEDLDAHPVQVGEGCHHLTKAVDVDKVDEGNALVEDASVNGAWAVEGEARRLRTL